MIDPVIEPAEIGSLPAFRFVDVRDAVDFEGAHAPGAVLVPVKAWEAAAKDPASSLENVGYWGQAIASAGIDHAAPALVYDDGRLTEAARVWFILQYFGVRSAIVNGGWPALAALPNGLPRGVDRSVGDFKARSGVGEVGLIERSSLQRELGSATRILDARTTAEFAADDLRANTRGGHLPGARNIGHAELLDQGLLKPGNKLRTLLEAQGFTSGDHLVTHCDGGGRAALAAAAALRAGFEDVRVYYLSFADWAADESCPVMKTATRGAPSLADVGEPTT